MELKNSNVSVFDPSFSSNYGSRLNKKCQFIVQLLEKKLEIAYNSILYKKLITMSFFL